MDTQLNSTALLLFVRTEQEEARCKPLAGSRKASAALFRQFNRHMLQQVRRTGLPLFIVQGDQQIGTTFGERLANAYQSVFDLGYDRVIAIGNDCPELNTQLLLEAANQLERHPMVLGPTDDGGAYLIGFQRAAFQIEAFVKLPWQTDTVYEALLTSAEGTIAVLDPSFDIDQHQTLRRQLWRIPVVLRRLISRLLGPVGAALFKENHSLPSVSYQLPVGLRAPPVLTFQ